MKHMTIFSWLLLIIFSTSIAFASIPVSKNAKPKPDRIFTVQDLAKYDGKEGRAAYVAVNGVVYDQTGVPAWLLGEHKGGKAGTDITDKIKKSPHGLSVLAKRKKVGTFLVTANVKI